MKFKSLSKTESTFYIFETSTTTYSVFDSKIDIPIYVGSWNMCASIIRSIKTYYKNATILYYYMDTNNRLMLSNQWSYFPKTH